MTFREDQGKEEPDAEEMFEEPAKKKRRGAYFKEINMRTLLRKTRAKVSEPEILWLTCSDEERLRPGAVCGTRPGLDTEYRTHSSLRRDKRQMSS
jgi:hypothetical protein